MIDLTKLRDELAAKEASYFNAQPEVYCHIEKCLKFMFDQAIHALTEAAGEFDEETIARAIEERIDECVSDRDLKVAKLQFEQDRLVIAIERGRVDAIARQRDELEARLTENAQFNIHLRASSESLEDKLTAAEARVKELEARVKYMNEDAKGISE